MADFRDLLQDAEQMTAQIDKENAGLPRLQRTLSQLIEVNKRKLTKTTNYLSTDDKEINASILLAAKGIDAPRLSQAIENLNIEQPIAAAPSPSKVSKAIGSLEKLSNIEQLREIDLQSFLKSEKESALMAIVEETRLNTMKEIEESYMNKSEQEWEKQKQKIMQELLGTFNPDLSLSSMTSSTLSARSFGLIPQNHRTIMSDVEIEFAKEIYAYNQKIVTKEKPKPDLLANFTALVQRLNDKNIEEAWSMLYYMSNIPSNKIDYDDYTDLQTQSFDRDNSPQVQMFFVNQALSYLEICFKELIQNTVNANLKQAKLGGALGTLSIVSAYLRLSQSEKYHKLSDEKFDENQPLWPTIYLCLRCGDKEEARNVAMKTKNVDIANYLDEIIKDTSNLNLRGHLSTPNENKLRLEYKSKIKRSSDVYKRAVYSYLCRLSGDDDSITDVLDNVDNFLWFKLNSCVFTPTQANVKDLNTSSATPDHLTFQEFQAKLSIDFGEKYFTQNRNPFTYLQVLLLTAQFEQAIEFLLKYETMVVHGVHMAIGLFERKLLNLTKTPSCSQLITSGEAHESRCLRRINFVCLLRMYTRKFEGTDPREALQYYYFLRNLKPTQTSTSILDGSKQPKNYFAQSIIDLALETREFELLFGRLEKNAIRRPGIIDKFIDETEAADIIELVAKEIENKGLTEEAIQLFDLCKQHQLVLELCNKLISQVVTEINVPNSNRDRLKCMVSSIAMRYKTETNVSTKAIQKSTITTFYLLTDLMTFFDLYHSENWDLAYETLNKLAILPMTSNGVDTKVKEFIAFSEEIKRNFPDLILAAMTIISNLFARITKTSSKGISFQTSGLLLNGSNEMKQILMQLKEHAKALIKFVGCIPYRLSGDINARLLQLEVMMN